MTTRSNLPLGRRIDALWAAARIEAQITDSGIYPTVDAVWQIVAQLRDPAVKRERVRISLDRLLAAPLDAARLPWLRFYVGKVEEALGLPHDARSAEALRAFEAHTLDGWSAYRARLQRREAVALAVAEAAP